MLRHRFFVLNEKNNNMKKYLFLLVVPLLFAACEPSPDEHKLYDELVVSTNYDPEANFESYLTYTMPTDTIGFASNQTRDTLLTHQNSDLVRPIINKLRANLDTRGFTKVDKKDSPDLGINVQIVNNLNMFQQYVDPGYYYPYYYGYSSYYYYPYIQTYVENTATLVVQVVDLKNRNAQNQVKVVWLAYMGDLISTVDRLSQIEKAIDQAFVQSTYLNAQ